MIDWIHELFDPSTPVVIVNQPQEDGNSAVHELKLPNWIMTMPFLRNGRGAMHIKVRKAYFAVYSVTYIISCS